MSSAQESQLPKARIDDIAVRIKKDEKNQRQS